MEKNYIGLSDIRVIKSLYINTSGYNKFKIFWDVLMFSAYYALHKL